MDYQTAVSHFTARSPLRRRLDGHNNTWLHRASAEPTEPIHVRLFRTDIITFFPDGSFSVAIDGYITSTTKDRFRRYLPRGLCIWSEHLGGGVYIAMLHRRGGSLPCSNRAHFTPDFKRDDLEEMNSRSAGRVRSRIAEYAKEYVHRLIFQGLPAPHQLGDCVRCMRWRRPVKGSVERGLDSFVVVPDETNRHYLEHLDAGTMPPSLLLCAIDEYQPSLREPTLMLFGPGRCLLRAPRTQYEALLQTEAELKGWEAPSSDPRKNRAALRNVLERFLLERLGFELILQRDGLSQGMNRGMKAAEMMGWNERSA
jgi:hypothetical protein